MPVTTKMMPVTKAIIGSYNGLSPDWRQAIILNNYIGTSFKMILTKIDSFEQEHVCVNVVWKMSVILAHPEWVYMRSSVHASVCSTEPHTMV